MTFTIFKAMRTPDGPMVVSGQPPHAMDSLKCPDFDWGKFNDGAWRLAEILMHSVLLRRPTWDETNECLKWIVSELPEEKWIMTRDELIEMWKKVPRDTL